MTVNEDNDLWDSMAEQWKKGNEDVQQILNETRCLY